ncbi:hypothetical protein SAMN05660236_4753 [Ohtaekwangia koreensis]|uniref:Uncharacterized protein n=1 Tax=Ohtaekwangia koreensis TaxID=688867 RepID=A0A1T5M7Y4_9BACT|nr:hypothetical protein SAMN05660236_4753 [Ohtaekwangia koreensis]
MPLHSFRSITLSSNTETADYFLLHLLYDNKVELDYAKTSFLKYDLLTKEKVEIDNKPVLFSDYKDFRNKQKELVTTTDFFYESERYFYKTEYDIFWGHAYSIFVNEKVKNELEVSNLKGLSISEFKKYEVDFSSI